MRFVRVCLFQLGTFVFHATRVSTKASSSTLSYLIRGRSYHYTMCVRVCMCVRGFLLILPTFLLPPFLLG